MDNNDFKKHLDVNQILYDENKLLQLEKYYNCLIEYNQHTNLTNITLKSDVYLKHFFDSLIVLKYFKLNNKRIIDLGSGAGFPGLVLAIFLQDSQVTLVESTGKKTIFLEKVVQELSLNNVTIINQRAEELALLQSEQYDFVTARAVAGLSILMELSSPFLKINGKLIAYKTDPALEIKNSSTAAKKLGLKIKESIEYNLPIENSKRSFIIVEKIKTTPKQYPRNYNQIKRNPL